MNTPSLRRRYLESFAGPGTPEASERGRAGYSFGRRYLASLLGIRLLPQPPSATDSRSDPEVQDRASHHRADAAATTSNDPMSVGSWQDAEGSAVEDVGYKRSTACLAAGITYRQLDYWARTGLVPPSVQPADSPDPERSLYSFGDILVLKVIKRLLDTGISLQQIRAAVHHLRNRETSDLARITLMSDGNSVYECTSADEVVNLLQSGQGVFGIALGRIRQEVKADLTAHPAIFNSQTQSHDLEGAQEPGSAERREQAEELLASLPETVSSMSHLPTKEREELVILLADLPTTISGLAELPGVVRSAAAGGERDTA